MNFIRQIYERARLPPQTRSHAMRGHRLPTVRTLLMGLVLGCMLPGMVGTIFLFIKDIQVERKQLEQSSVQMAHALSLVLDQKFSQLETTALMLAQDQTLRDNKLALFQNNAVSALARVQIAGHMVLSDASGQVVLNTLTDFGAALPLYGNQAQLRQVFATGQSVISDVFIGGFRKKHAITIAVPVFNGGKIIYVLSISFDPERINELLRQQSFPKDWIAFALDSKGVIAARTYKFEETVGKAAALTKYKMFNEQNEGVIELVSQEGARNLTAFSTAPNSKWRVGIGIPRESLELALMRKAALMGVGLLLLLGLGIVLALFMGRRIARSVTGLTLPARDLIDGNPLRVPKVYFEEANEVATAMADTSQKLGLKSIEVQIALQNSRDSEKLLIEANLNLESRVMERTQALADLYNQAPCGYHSLDAQGLIIDINQTALDLLGYTREAVIGQSPTQFFDAKNIALFAQVFPKLMRDGKLENIEHEVICKDGSHIPVLISSNLVFDVQGQVVGSRATMINNSVNKARQQKIADLSLFLTEVMESLTFGVVVLNEARDVVLRNQQFGPILGYPPELAQKESLNFAEMVRFNFDRGDYPDQTYEEVLGGFLQLMHDRKTICFERLQANGTYLEVRGKVISKDWILLIYTDITAFKTAEQVLAQAREAAEVANLAKSQFLANMSHEIRTPLNAVLGMAQVLMQPNISESNRRDYAGTILNSGQSLLALLNDILDLSKIEAGKLDLEAIALAPAQLIGEIKDLFTPSTRAKGLTIEVRWNGPENRYLGDPNRLSQMLSNLVGNAIKFTLQGVIRIEAREVVCTEQTATLEFSVSDSGIGIAKDKQALLFQTFSQADNSTTRQFGGSGLGLSIVRKLAQAMGGESGLESEAGIGSRFWFRIQADLLPADALDLHEQAGISTTSGVGATITPLRGRVLVIEDNPVNQMVMKVMLGQMGLEVALADDGQQALDALMGGERVQLILTDLQMPVMDGYQAAQRIRQWEAQTQQKRHPIIALSADAFTDVRVRCLAVGMDEMMSKPVMQGDLWAVLEKWLPAAPLAPQKVPTRLDQKSVDPAAISALVSEILPMLAQGKADAIDRFKALQELVADSTLAPELAEVGLPLKKFHFDLARERLDQMASKYEWSATP